MTPHLLDYSLEKLSWGICSSSKIHRGVTNFQDGDKILLRGFAWIWVTCYNSLGPKLHIDICHMSYVDLWRCVFSLFLIFWPFLDLQSDFSERRFLVALCHLHPNILWVDPTIWYRSRDISLTTPDTLIIMYKVLGLNIIKHYNLQMMKFVWKLLVPE